MKNALIILNSIIILGCASSSQNKSSCVSENLLERGLCAVQAQDFEQLYFYHFLTLQKSEAQKIANEFAKNNPIDFRPYYWKATLSLLTDNFSDASNNLRKVDQLVGYHPMTAALKKYYLKEGEIELTEFIYPEKQKWPEHLWDIQKKIEKKDYETAKEDLAFCFKNISPGSLLYLSEVFRLFSLIYEKEGEAELAKIYNKHVQVLFEKG